MKIGTRHLVAIPAIQILENQENLNSGAPLLSYFKVEGDRSLHGHARSRRTARPFTHFRSGRTGGGPGGGSK